MTSEYPWAQVISALSADSPILDQAQRTALLQTAVGLGADLVDDSIGCSITQAVGTRYHTPVASGSLAIDLDLAQYAADDGPCIAACRDGRVHDIAIMGDTQVHPEFAAVAQQHGVQSSLSMPLHSGEHAAALNLYASSTSAFKTPHARSSATLLARCIAQLVRAEDDEKYLTEPPPDVLERRARYQRACTVLRGRGLDAPAAFDRMSRSSRDSGRSIFDIADEISASGGRDG